MKKSTIITIIAFALGVVVLATGFILLTDNNISNKLFSTTNTTTTTTTGDGGNDDPEYSPMDLFNTDVSQYITLGQYEGLEIEVDQLEVEDGYIEQQITIMLFQESEYEKVEEGTVEEGVIFNFDYKGYINDVPFEGGSATGTNAYIDGDQFITVTSSGTGSFIDGFAQGVIGATVGETIDVPVTFPEDYYNEDYAGKDAIFKVTVNYIAKTELTDEWVNEYTSGQYTTGEELIQYFKDYINDSIEENLLTAVWTKIVENATVIEIPQQEYDYYYNMYSSEVEYYASMYGVTFETMLTYYGFEDVSEFEKFIESSVKNELVVYAVMQAESFEVTEEEYKALLTELIAISGKTEAEILEEYGEERLNQSILMDKVDKFVRENNSFVLTTEK